MTEIEDNARYTALLDACVCFPVGTADDRHVPDDPDQAASSPWSRERGDARENWKKRSLFMRQRKKIQALLCREARDR